VDVTLNGSRKNNMLMAKLGIYFDEEKDDTVNPLLNQDNYAYLELLIFSFAK